MAASGNEAPVIVPAESAEDLATVRALFLEYANWLDFDLCFQGFEQELAELPGSYVPPAGGLWLAKVGAEAAGVVGLRPLEAGACELKRLWIRPDYRGLRLGRAMTETAIAAAKSAGHDVMRLDTIGGTMQQAIALYEAAMVDRPGDPEYRRALADLFFQQNAALRLHPDAAAVQTKGTHHHEHHEQDVAAECRSGQVPGRQNPHRQLNAGGTPDAGAAGSPDQKTVVAGGEVGVGRATNRL